MKYKWVLPCFLLAACNVAHDEDKQAGQTLSNWDGKKVAFALNALGRPNQIINRTDGHIYTWNGTRKLAGGGIIVGTDGQASYSKSRDNTHITPCRLTIVADKDGIILKTSLNGTDLGCQEFAEKINNAQNIHDDLRALDGMPVQMVMNAFGPTDAEGSKKGEMFYQWRKAEGERTCLLHVRTDQDGKIVHSYLKGKRAACDKFIDGLNSITAGQKVDSVNSRSAPNH